MKSMATIIGIILLIAGTITLAYQGFTYTQREKIVQIGDVQVTADTQKTIYFPPYLGGISLVAGVILLALNRK